MVYSNFLLPSTRRDGRNCCAAVVNIRPLRHDDVDQAVTLHLEVLDMEFLSRAGPRFMRTYYRAWTSTTGDMSLAAVDNEGRLLGALLGATNPAVHVRAMVKEHGIALAMTLLAATAIRPRLARDLIATRATRYVRGIGRLLANQLRPTPPTVPSQQAVVGEITHVLVDPEAQGRGVGRALVEAAVNAARAAGVAELVLVTPPDMAAQHFYRALGWDDEGSMVSRSGEAFLRFRLRLR